MSDWFDFKEVMRRATEHELERCQMSDPKVMDCTWCIIYRLGEELRKEREFCNQNKQEENDEDEKKSKYQG